MLAGDSGGGSFFLGATLTALAGASSFLPVFLSPSLAPDAKAVAACDEADIVELGVVAWRVARCQYFAVSAESRIADASEAEQG